MDHPEVLSLTADIVSAYVENHTVPAAELPDLIAKVSQALINPTRGAQEEQAQPAVAIRSSIHEDGITCLDCGKTFKTLRHHLRTRHGMLPEEYRSKWNLAESYPLTAPEYSDRRKNLAISFGLGKGSHRRSAA